MNKKYIYAYIICLAYSFVINGMQAETAAERTALLQRARDVAEQFQRNRAVPLPDYNVVFITEIENALNKKIVFEVGHQGQDAFGEGELQEHEKTNISIPLAHRGARGFPVISISIEGSDKVLTYRPSGSTQKVKLKITDENGEIELLKYKDEE